MYTIKLTDAELDTLAWATDHGYFPAQTYDAMHSIERAEELELTTPSGKTEFAYEIPEHAAWAITMQREDDPHSLFACIGGALLEKLLALENSIV